MRAPRCVALCTQGSTAATSTLRSDRSQTSGRLPKLMLQRVPSRHKQEASQPLGGPALTAPGTATPTAPEDRLGTSAEDSTVQRAQPPLDPLPGSTDQKARPSPPAAQSVAGRHCRTDLL